MMRDPHGLDCRCCPHDNEAHDPLMGCLMCRCNIRYPMQARDEKMPLRTPHDIHREQHREHGKDHRELLREISRVWFWTTSNGVIGVLNLLLFVVLILLQYQEI